MVGQESTKRGSAMTRIIAGRAGGRTLRTPPGSGTRPTSDRVREALFSALQARDLLEGARVLDLYAGSGALGLEAASRGAAEVVLVESDRRAAKVIADNIKGLALPGVRARPTTVATYLGSRPTAYATQETEPQRQGTFDLVFIDPPYDLAESDLTAVLEALATDDWLADDALVIVERSTRSPEPTWPVGWTAEKVRRYGETALWFAGC
ncbi:MAG TPA: 16S rRNA (guanine(966)-N(2))-methyltransferase RsmD [Phycicoccus sp.]|nr:16S rRNA (guanine(966)-N(2))-methyltransferase RsmD [Phycicoccus sp.]